MAKSIITDGVVAIMHFNSSVPAYQQAWGSGSSRAECCYCHKHLDWKGPKAPGQSTWGRCRHCGNTVTYQTLVMSEAIAAHFDVRGGSMYGSTLSVGGVLHIVLPVQHPEFDRLIHGLSTGTGIRVSPSSREAVLNDIAARIISDVRERVLVRCDQARLADGRVTDRPLAKLGDAFYRFGKLFIAQEVEYPTAVYSRVGLVVKTVAIDLDQHLTSLVTDHEADLTHDLMRISVNFIYPAISSRFSHQLDLPNG